jgi:hypothetical protein
MKKIILFYLFILTNINISYSQGASDCFTKHQILKMQSSSIDDIRFFLNNEGWSFDGAEIDQVFDYFNYELNFNIVSWEKNSYNSNDKLLIYTADKKPNIIIVQTNNLCFTSLIQSFKDFKAKVIIDNDKLVTIYNIGQISVEFREYKNDYSTKQFSILVYNSAAILNEIKEQKEKDDSLKKIEAEEIRKHQLAIEFVNQGDLLYVNQQYDSAIVKFKIASVYSNEIENLQEKINKVERKIIESKLSIIQIKADKYFDEKNLDSSLVEYNKILALDINNRKAHDRIQQIESIKKLLEKRSSSVFPYSKLNTNDFTTFENSLIDDINFQIKSKDSGILKLDYAIIFDTLGNNLSKINYLSSSLADFNLQFQNLTSKNILKPTIEGGYFLSAKENLTIDINWYSKKLKYYYKKGWFCPSLSNSNDFNEINYKIENFLNNQELKCGIFLFNVKNKNTNGKIFQDIELINHRVEGPEVALLSMILPGLGTLYLSRGQKGIGRLLSFVVFSSISIYLKGYSNSQYEKYLVANNQSDIQLYFDRANLSHKVSLISGTISAAIYLNDIFSTIKKGKLNLEYSQNLKNILSKKPIQILNQSIIF